VEEGLTPRNAERLEEFVVRGRREADTLAEDDKNRRSDAIDAVAGYVKLLRETAPSERRQRYEFKLEFPDGRWDIAEQAMTAEPRVGDLVWFGSAAWQILGRRQVPRPRTNTPHTFLACAPAAA
jgi:hypothetical protein